MYKKIHVTNITTMLFFVPLGVWEKTLKIQPLKSPRSLCADVRPTDEIVCAGIKPQIKPSDKD